MPNTLAGRYNRPVRLGSVIEIGWRAREALDRATSARVLSPMRASIYIVVNGQILWLGGPADVMHPRAVRLSQSPDLSGLVAGDTLSVPPCTVAAWRAAPLRANPAGATALRRAAGHLVKSALTLGEPTGFGAWLAARPLAFPLAGAGKSADALAGACASDNAAGAAEAALALLGFGAGLTPSGDDFVGGAFFARAALTQLGEANSVAWQQAAATVRSAAGVATHPISAALLGDLLDGHGWSPLHDLARALASDDAPAAIDAAARLTRLGHSSGWDVLAGFLGALTAPLLHS